MTEWFPFLIQRGDTERNALFSRVVFKPNRHFAICRDNGLRKTFAKFDGYCDLFYHISQTPVDERCFFEVIQGDALQKMYFDIDMKPESMGSASPLEITQYVKSLGQAAAVACSSFAKSLIFSSSDFSKKGKISFHIIIDGVFFESHVNVASAVTGIIDSQRGKIPNFILDAVDTGVYKSIQQLRILNCQKFGSGRVKKLIGDFTSIIGDKDTRPDELSLFAASLVTEVSLCKPVGIESIVSSFLTKHKPHSVRQQRGELTTHDDVPIAFESIVKELEMRGIEAPFEIRDDVFTLGDDGLIVSLIRTSPSFCPVCVRIHDLENPFITINLTSKIATLNCRRADAGAAHLSISYSEKENAINKCSCPPEFSGKNAFGYNTFFKAVKFVFPKSRVKSTKKSTSVKIKPRKINCTEDDFF